MKNQNWCEHNKNITGTYTECPLCKYDDDSGTSVGTGIPDGHTDTINEKQEQVCSHHWQMACYDNFAYYSPQAIVICIHCGQLKSIKIQ